MNKFVRLTAVILLVAAAALALSGCANLKREYEAYSFDYFDTVTRISGYEITKGRFDERIALIENMLSEYHKLFDIYTEYQGIKNLKTVNALHNGVHTEVKVDEKIINMLTLAKEMHEISGGEVNIAMGSVLSIWHKYRKAGENDVVGARLPGEAELAAAAEHTDISSVVINKEKSTVYISDPSVTIDVGAIAKGYAVEMVARELEEMGVTGYILNVGGNVRTLGAKPSGALWKLGIQNPGEEDGGYAAIVSLGRGSLVTSGSYQRYYIVNGKSYHHVIDGETLMPADHFESVSVIYSDSGVADGLSTALFCMPYEDGLALLARFEGAEAMWITKDGEKLYSSGFSAYIVK